MAMRQEKKQPTRPVERAGGCVKEIAVVVTTGHCPPHTSGKACVCAPSIEIHGEGGPPKTAPSRHRAHCVLLLSSLGLISPEQIICHRDMCFCHRTSMWPEVFTE